MATAFGEASVAGRLAAPSASLAVRDTENGEEREGRRRRRYLIYNADGRRRRATVVASRLCPDMRTARAQESAAAASAPAAPAPLALAALEWPRFRVVGEGNLGGNANIQGERRRTEDTAVCSPLGHYSHESSLHKQRASNSLGQFYVQVRPYLSNSRAVS